RLDDLVAVARLFGQQVQDHVAQVALLEHPSPAMPTAPAVPPMAEAAPAMVLVCVAAVTQVPVDSITKHFNLLPIYRKTYLKIYLLGGLGKGEHHSPFGYGRSAPQPEKGPHAGPALL